MPCSHEISGPCGRQPLLRDLRKPTVSEKVTQTVAEWHRPENKAPKENVFPEGTSHTRLSEDSNTWGILEPGHYLMTLSHSLLRPSLPWPSSISSPISERHKKALEESGPTTVAFRAWPIRNFLSGCFRTWKDKKILLTLEERSFTQNKHLSLYTKYGPNQPLDKYMVSCTHL